MKIVIMYVLKGLEYLIVFMLFVCGYCESKEVFYYKDGKLIYDFVKSDEVM